MCVSRASRPEAHTSVNGQSRGTGARELAESSTGPERVQRGVRSRPWSLNASSVTIVQRGHGEVRQHLRVHSLPRPCTSASRHSTPWSTQPWKGRRRINEGFQDLDVRHMRPTLEREVDRRERQKRWNKPAAAPPRTRNADS